MGFWPFGGSKRQRSSAPNRQTQEKLIQSQSLEDNTKLEKASTDLGSDEKRDGRRDRDSRMSSRTQGTSGDYKPRSQTEPISVPGSKRVSRNVRQPPGTPIYQHEPTSQSSLGPENFTVVRQPPTLHARRADFESNITRRKSSKRKAEDHARELEVRAMSSSPIPIPKRPNSFYGSGPLQRETKQIPGNLNRKLARPTSQVSLPMVDAYPGISDLSNQNSFKVGVLAALSPRPTVRYDSNPVIGRGKQSQSQRPNLLAQSSIFEEEGADKKRIDELADDLDAGGLRELMERDKRRRERKKEQERLRLQRKLQRRADRQKEEEARQARTEEYVSNSATRVGLGIQPPKAGRIATEDDQAGPSGTRRDDFRESYQKPTTSTPVSPAIIRNPFEDEKDLDVMQYEESDRETEPPIPVKSPLRNLQAGNVALNERPLQAALSPPTSPIPRGEDRQSISQGSLLNREVTTDVPENASIEGRASDHSSQRLSSWTTFFRRGTRRKVSSSFQGRSTPSEFSNTSRESFAARKQTIPTVTPRTFRRADSATPQRTMSKFREDLPELPISPPDSRLQSPEATEVTPGDLDQAIAATKKADPMSTQLEDSGITPKSPISARLIPGQGASMAVDIPSAAKADVTLSQSLASVDSEGSWLSGKALNRLSGPSQKLKASRSSLSRTIPGAFDGGNDVVAPSDTVAERDRDREIMRRSSQNEKSDETWHSGLGRQATLIRQASRAKSKEGLLKEYTAKEEDKQASSPESDDDAQDTGDDEVEVVEPTIMRAKSVDYKGHSRHYSGGSARLLDIRRQSSVHSETSLAQQEHQRRAASYDQLSRHLTEGD